MISILLLIQIALAIVVLVLFALALINSFGAMMSDSQNDDYKQAKKTSNILLVFDLLTFIAFILTFLIH